MIPYYNRIDSNETRDSTDETTAILNKSSDRDNHNADKISLDSFHSQLDDRNKNWLKKRNVLILIGCSIIVVILILAIFILEPWKK